MPGIRAGNAVPLVPTMVASLSADWIEKGLDPVREFDRMARERDQFHSAAAGGSAAAPSTPGARKPKAAPPTLGEESVSETESSGETGRIVRNVPVKKPLDTIREVGDGTPIDLTQEATGSGSRPSETQAATDSVAKAESADGSAMQVDSADGSAKASADVPVAAAQVSTAADLAVVKATATGPPPPWATTAEPKAAGVVASGSSTKGEDPSPMEVDKQYYPTRTTKDEL